MLIEVCMIFSGHFLDCIPIVYFYASLLFLTPKLNLHMYLHRSVNESQIGTV